MSMFYRAGCNSLKVNCWNVCGMCDWSILRLTRSSRTKMPDFLKCRVDWFWSKLTCLQIFLIPLSWTSFRTHDRACHNDGHAHPIYNTFTFWRPICLSIICETLFQTLTMSARKKSTFQEQWQLRQFTECNAVLRELGSIDRASDRNSPSSVSFGMAEKRFFFASETSPCITSAILAGFSTSLPSLPTAKVRNSRQRKLVAVATTASLCFRNSILMS